MKSSIFLSYPKPYLQKQQDFISLVIKYLNSRDIQPRTLGVTDYDNDAPLTAIKRLMSDCNGQMTIAFRRGYIKNGNGWSSIESGSKTYSLSNKWITSPYCHIEPAMAFQLGLPIIILREKGVIADGILQHGVTDRYLPEFDLDSTFDYLNTNEWKQIVSEWEACVKLVSKNKGLPPRLY